MSYRIEWEQDAKQALDQLDIPIIHAILKRINWLSVNFNNIKPKRLTGRLKSDFRLRAGDYRVIYSVNRKSKVLIIRLVGHRSDIYRQ